MVPLFSGAAKLTGYYPGIPLPPQRKSLPKKKKKIHNRETQAADEEMEIPGDPA